MLSYPLDHFPAALAPIVAQLAKTAEGIADLAVSALGHRPLLTTNPVDRSDVTRLEVWTGMTKDALDRRFHNLFGNRPAWLLEMQPLLAKSSLLRIPAKANADGTEN